MNQPVQIDPSVVSQNEGQATDLVPRETSPATAANADHGKTLRQIPIGSITPNPHQPRKTFNEEALDSLAESILSLIHI